MADSCVYDVFLSFSGVDTRKKFTGHLLAALDRHGFYTFRDDTKLKRGEEVGPGLFKAIEESRVSVIVFSQNYASSRWCLDELVKIMDCKRKLNQIVIPIFYDVKSSDVRSQSGCYAEAFSSHNNQFDFKSVKNWRSALAKAGNLSGYSLRNVANGDESTLIKRVVREVADKLNRPCLSVADHPVGIQRRVHGLSEFLQQGQAKKDVRIVVIWGTGGIGKTTIAKEMYNRIHREFESSSFLSNIGQTSKQHKGLVELQEKLLCDLLMDRNQTITMEDNGTEVIKQRAWGKRVLLVLDDVDNINQLTALAVDGALLVPGSRIIVTTRDSSLVDSFPVNYIVRLYQLAELNKVESLQLFCWHAFRRDRPREGYEIESEEVVSYAKGLPLVLKILGSYLSNRTIREWTSELEKLKKIPHHDVQAKLRLSYDSLDGEQKGLFLHIACFFVGMDQDLSIKILKGCGFFPEAGIGILSRRCLVSIDWHNGLIMHDLIQQMAREIVRKESPEEPGKRSRLWNYEDVLDVLESETGTEAVQGLVLNLPSEELQQNVKVTKSIQDSVLNLPKSTKLDAQAFAEMKGLRLLHLNYFQLSGSCQHLSKRLVWLSWKGFSSNYIPSSLFMKNLIALDLSYSKLEQVWEETKLLCKLKYLNLSHSSLLIKTPDFTGFTSLEKLLLNDCIKLVEVHKSVGCLENLIVLNLQNCPNLEKIPLSIFMLKSLVEINMSGCSNLQWPAFFQESPPESSFSSLQLSSSISELSMENCNISYVPSEISGLVSLEFLNLSGNDFSILPSTITSHRSLKVLFVNRCFELESVPALPVNLRRLSANYCTSLQNISIETKVANLPFMTFYSCNELVNNNFANNFRRNLLSYQGLCELGELNIHLSGGEIPSWCNYQGHFHPDIKANLRFRVPQLEGGRKIQGFIVCLVFTSDNFNFTQHTEYDSDHFSFLHDVSKAKNLSSEQVCYLDYIYPPSCGDEMWLSYIPNRCLESDYKLECGDEVEMGIGEIYDYLKPKKWGISLVYEGDEKDPDSITMADEDFVPPFPIGNYKRLLNDTFFYSLNVKKVWQ